jgi:hypothetical protein
MQCVVITPYILRKKLTIHSVQHHRLHHNVKSYILQGMVDQELISPDFNYPGLTQNVHTGCAACFDGGRPDPVHLQLEIAADHYNARTDQQITPGAVLHALGAIAEIGATCVACEFARKPKATLFSAEELVFRPDGVSFVPFTPSQQPKE